jgi:hypothetical protein
LRTSRLREKDEDFEVVAPTHTRPGRPTTIRPAPAARISLVWR